MVEWWEDGQEDHKILAVLPGAESELSDEAKKKITYFAQHYFDHVQDKKYSLGKFLGQAEANELIKKSGATS